MKKMYIFAIIGLLLGIPLSYYFQPDIIQKLTLSQYLSNLSKVLSDKTADFVTPLILSCVLCALGFGVVGYFIDQAGKKSESAKKPVAQE